MRKLILFALVIIFSQCSRPAPPVNKAQKGFLNLREVDFSTRAYVPLDGEWIFLPFYVSENKTREIDKPGQIIQVPGTWNKIFPNGHGRGRYRLDIDLPDSEQKLALRLQTIYSAWRIYINGELISNFGEPGVDRATTSPKVGYRSLPLPATQYSSMRIELEVANYTNIAGGIQRQIFLGRTESIERQAENDKLLRVMISVVLAMAFLNHFFHFLFHPARKSHLYFGFICLCLALRNLTLGEMILYDFGFSYYTAAKVLYGSLFPLMAGVILFVDALFPSGINRIFKFTGIAATSIFTMTLFLPLQYFLQLRFWAEIFILIILLVMIAYLVYFAFKKRPFALVLVINFIIISLAAVNDILHTNEVITTMLVSNYSVLVLVIVLSLMLSYEFSRAYRRVDHIAVELSEANKKLLSFKSDLENTVKVRTEELYQTNLQLEDERNELQKQNLLMQADLELARRIQSRLIPEKAPIENIAWYYSSLDKVCGDFFDFIPLAHDSKFGIFLSDVSGHGVPAAFITSLIKGILIETAPQIEDPALLLARLYDSLFEQMSGHFVSAIYAIYDNERHELSFAISGHPPPFLLHNGKLSKLKSDNPGPIIGIFSGNELWQRGRQPMTSRYTLRPGDKIIFFTDGLTEATPAVDDYNENERIMFEHANLEHVLASHANSSAQKLVSALSAELIKYRGNEKFEDDVCIICLEY